MQSYTNIPVGQSLQSSLSLLLNNDKTALSCSSGSSYPTTELVVGMLCFRTDQQKLYILKSISPSTWVMLLDVSGSNSSVRELAANVFVNAEGANEGGQINIAKPETNTLLMGHVAFDVSGSSIRFWENGGTNRGIYIDISTCAAGIASKVWHSGNDGADSGLDADMLDGKQSGNTNGAIPISNGTVNTNLNADMVDGKHAGNNTGQIPISNGTICTDLNADKLDGYHASSFVRTIQGVSPDASGNVVVDLLSKVSKSGDTMSGDLKIYRSEAPTTGVVFLGNGGTHYLHFDGTTYHMPAANLMLNGQGVFLNTAVGQGAWRDTGQRTYPYGTYPPYVRSWASFVNGYELYRVSDTEIGVRTYGGMQYNCDCNCNCDCNS